MNMFNRVVVITLLVLLIVSGLVIATLPEAILTLLQDWTTGAVVTPQDRIASAVLGAALVIIGAVAVYVELRPTHRKTVVISRLADGRAALEVESIAQRIKQEVELLDGVKQVASHVTARGKNVDVRLLVLTATEVDVPEKAAEIGTVVRDCVAKMGVGMGRQQINLRYQLRSPKAG